MKDNKIIFVFTNNPISLSNSNGRTIFNLLRSLDNYKIYNLYVHSGKASLNNINYFRITDRDVLKCFFHRKHCSFANDLSIESSSDQGRKKHFKKTAFKMLVRGFFWLKNMVLNDIINFAKTIKPDILLYQVGDSYFFNKIAIELKKKLDIPLLAYDTEDYYFKKWDFLKARSFKGPFFSIFKLKYDRSFRELLSFIDRAVFLTEDLEELHKNSFPLLRCEHIYNSFSNVVTKGDNLSNNQILYSGNLEVGRVETIIKISQALNRIDPELKISVYSQTKDKKILSKMKPYKNIIFFGEVSYKDNLDLLSNASLLLHVESFKSFYVKDCAHAFSTKIPDCLASLKPLLVVAPSTCSIFKYIDKNKCGWVCDDSENLDESIGEIIRLSFFNKYENGALEAVKTNHNPENNSLKMLRIIEELI